MIYDCFNFYNELDLLELRLRELNSVVDRFVLVESTVTFTNKPKPLFYQENKKRFAEFHKKIIHVIVEDSPNVSLPWIIEHFQFAAVLRGLKKAQPNDIILLSCVDEIPRKELIQPWSKKQGSHKMFQQRVCEYFLNFAGIGEGSVWPCTSMFTYMELAKHVDPYIARFTPADVLIPDGGWHFTFIGDIKRIQNKLQSWSHQEYNNDGFNTKEYLEQAISHGSDILGRKLHFSYMPLSFLPTEVQLHTSAYTDILITAQPKSSRLTDSVLMTKKQLRILVRRVLRKRKTT